MPVPVRIEAAGGKVRQVMVMVDQPHESFTIPVEQPAKKVTFNPDFAVLARTVKR